MRIAGNGRRSQLARTLGAVAAFAFALAAQDSPQLQRLSVGKTSADSLTFGGPDRTWHLDPVNQTTTIESAYRYKNHLVVFGFADSAGLTTIIDATSGQEQLEFLSWEPLITPKGLIVFKHFYPASADNTIVDESIAELDLNGTIPHDVPSERYGKHADDVGVTIYPRALMPDVRHFVDFFLATDGGTLFFAVDKLSSGEVCLVRIELPPASGGAMKRHCLPPETFGAHNFSTFDVTSDGIIERLVENNSNGLMLNVETGRRRAQLVQRSFEIDKNSLEVREVPIPVENPRAELSIPWPVAMSSLINFVAPDLGSKDLAAHLHEDIFTKRSRSY
jgi:hypothetical protein